MPNNLFAPPNTAELKLAQNGSPPGNANLFAAPTDSEMKLGQPQTFLGQHPKISGLVRSSLNALPMAGSIAGGVVGGGTGVAETLTSGGVAAPLAVAQAVGGSAAGGLAGQTVKDYLESKIFGDVNPAKESPISETAKGLMTGAENEMGGQILSKAVGAIPAITQSSNADAIAAAADKLGIKPTPGMLSDSPSFRSLENSLQQSPSIPGYLMRKQSEPIKQMVMYKIGGALDDASSLSPYEAGNEIKQGLISKTSEDFMPSQLAYKDIQSLTPDMELSANAQGRVANNLSNIKQATLMPSSPEAGIANRFAEGINNAKSVDDLESLSSSAKGILRDPNASYNEKQAAVEALSRIERLKNNSIIRNAIAAARNPQEGQDIGSDIISEIKGAHQSYRDAIQQYQQLGEGSGLTKANSGPSGIVNDIESTPSEKIPDMLFQTKNNDFLNFLKDKYPEQYNLAKQQKLRQIFQKSLGPDGNISPSNFMSAIKNYSPEVKAHLFGSDVDTLNDVKTVLQSIPGKTGASDTPRGLEYLHMFNPVQQATSFGRYGMYKAMQYSPQITGALQSPMARGLISVGTRQVNK
jgi:hypothetical protein